MAVCSLAAALLVVVLLRLEVRVDAHQFVLRWGDAPVEAKTSEPRVVARVVVRDDAGALAKLEERVGMVDDLMHAVITDFGLAVTRHCGMSLVEKPAISPGRR